MPITRRDLARPATEVARSLLGARVVSVVDGARVVVRLTELEAYGGVAADPSSHAHRGRTPRNTTMFERPGLLYVYFTYGKYVHCSG